MSDQLKEKRIERHFVYLWGIILFLLGIILIIASFLIPSSPFSSIIRTLGTALCPAAAVAFIFEYYIQDRWIQQLKDSINSDITIVSNEIGIKRIFRNKEEWKKEQANLYFNAKEISYLAVAPNFTSFYGDMVATALKLLQEGKNFRFLVCDPDKPFATQYYGYRETDSPLEDFKNEIMICMDRLKEIKKRNKGPGKIQAKIYDPSPGGYLQIIDNRIFFLPYLYGHLKQGPPMFEIEEGELFNSFKTHFDKIWKHAIDLENYLMNPHGEEK